MLKNSWKPVTIKQKENNNNSIQLFKNLSEKSKIGCSDILEPVFFYQEKNLKTYTYNKYLCLSPANTQQTCLCMCTLKYIILLI